MVNYQKIIMLLGADSETVKTDEEQYIQKVQRFLSGQDFVRLGHCIQGRQWHLVMSNSEKLKQHCTELGITCFDAYLKSLRDVARHQNLSEALQIMSRITVKRVQLRNLLSGEEEHAIYKA